MKKKLVIGTLGLLLLCFIAAEAFAEEKVELSLGANVEGASVYIDGEFVGIAPLKIMVTKGPHTVKMTGERVKDKEERVVINGRHALRLDLLPDLNWRDRKPSPKPEPVRTQSHTLSVNANVRGAQVFVEGRAMGNVPLRTKLDAGKYTIKVTAPGHVDFTTEVRLSDDTRIDAELQRVQQFHTLSVNANVRDAQVAIEGKVMGDVPLRTRLEEGRYTIKVTAPGYVDFTTEVRLTDDARIDANLQKAQVFHTLSVTASVRGAQVFIERKAMGTVPLRTKLEEGKYTVRVTAPGYEDFSTEVRLSDDTRVDADLKRALRSYTLGVTATARGAQVFIDGKLAGVAPLRTRIVEGEHEIRVTAPGFEDYSRKIDLNRDETVNVRLERIRRFFSLTVTADAPQARVWINGEAQEGTVPLTVKLEEGTYKVRVQVRWMRPYETTVTLNRDTRIRADLVPDNAKVKVVIPEDIFKRDRVWRGSRIVVSVDGKPQRGFEFEINRGRHVVRVEAGSWFVEKELNVRDGRLYTLTPAFIMEVEEERD